MVNLSKGQKVNLFKEAPNLNRLLVGLGWDEKKKFFSSSDYDIDASVITIDANGKKKDVVYYGHPNSDGITHGGDNLTGAGEGDDEQIAIVLDKLPRDVEKLAVIVNIYSAYSRKQSFGEIKNCYVHVQDLNSGKELVRFDVSKSGQFDEQTGIFVADIYRNGNNWDFEAIGQGVRVRDISEMVAQKCRR